MDLTVAVAGGHGYAAQELTRLLRHHPRVRALRLYARAEGGAVRPLADLPDSDADVVFLAVPADAARELAPRLRRPGRLVVDLSGGHRLPDPLYRAVYRDDASPAAEPGVYGLPEWFADRLRGAELVANPGCYATGLALLLYPLLAAGLDVPWAIATGISGHSGAGRALEPSHLLAEAAEDVTPYRPVGHPHIAEVETWARARFGRAPALAFTPHLAPLSRGLVVTVHVPCPLAESALVALYREAYATARFVRCLPPGATPRSRPTLGTNEAELAVAVDARSERAVLMVALDNLGKGAAGQAVQNMNLALGWDEALGLDWPALAV
jgi:N-acetyl-gamma-glutamyl-phosphate reductase